MDGSSYSSLPAQGSATFSPDRRWWWDGYRWVASLTPDGRWSFNGFDWVPSARRREPPPRWLTITGTAWLIAVGAWLVVGTVILAVSKPQDPDRAAGITVAVLGGLAVLATLAWGCLVGRRAATRWLWHAAAIGTGVQLFFYTTAMLAAPTTNGSDNDNAAGAGIVILALPAAAIILLLLWTGAAVGVLSRKLKPLQRRRLLWRDIG
jgi:drug/metabolite transporter superfamily protein YnfA